MHRLTFYRRNVSWWFLSLFVIASASTGTVPPCHYTTAPKRKLVESSASSSSLTRSRRENNLTKNAAIIVLEGAGGTDKDPQTGHRRDSIPLVKALLDAGVDSNVYQFQEEFSGDYQHDQRARAHNEALRSKLFGLPPLGENEEEETSRSGVVGVIARNNPGNLSPYSQKKLDDMLVDLENNRGVKVMSHPEVVRRMGSKDALHKIRELNCGMPDTCVYYNADEFKTGFRTSIAFRPRVIKQNRGSQGEGVWICKLKDESAYCDSFGESMVDLDTPLILTEANDNHVEEHTVGEFLEFCIHGRTQTAGEWTSTSNGQYLDGGKEARAMLVDQRFLPRIVEGEVRIMMIGSTLVEILHKQPKEGCVSATLQSGAIYTKHEPDAPEFASLLRNFEKDLPHIMSCFGMGDRPLPLLWSVDYIFGEKDEQGRDRFYIGELNCSCVGFTRQLDRATLIAKAAVEMCLPRQATTTTITKNEHGGENRTDATTRSSAHRSTRLQRGIGAAATTRRTPKGCYERCF